MPLEHSASKEALRHNMETLHSEIGKSPHVKSQAQAVAIALETQRRARERAMGGVAGVNPLAARALLARAQHGMAGMAPMMAATPQSMKPNMMPPQAGVKMLNDGGVAGMAGGGGFNMAQGPNLTAPWFERQEARQLHTGPVLSSVPGRTDNHKITVPAGSYVLPAQHVASMGHGNTLAGMSLASKMFSGPYGTSPMKMGHGSLPKAPRPMTSFAYGGHSDGGARGTDQFEPVPVDVSGGEYIIPPQAIIARYGSLDRGHQVLDDWIMKTRKDEIALQKKLPPPAKD
jgi:hypothetical protein